MLKPLAFLLVKFQGSPAEPITRATAEQMFTASGRGTLNVVDWFDENTHGSVDMGGNRVFGWIGLTDSLADYQAKRGNGTYQRTSIVDLARAAAVATGVDLTPFAAVVVVTNVGVDLFGGTGFTVCTAERGTSYWQNHMAPSVLCQEIIHGLGIYEHTRRDGSGADYQDPYDVMSMYNAFAGVHPDDPNLPAGPGLNAAFMKRCGWLDQSRGATQAQVQLRPLHRRDLAGYLYAVVDGYYVEYRPSQRWDTGFPSVVLVHYIKDNTSYLIAELREGSAPFTWTPSWSGRLSVFGTEGSIQVDRIDDANLEATLTMRSVQHRHWEAGPWQSLLQSEFADGGGLVILNGKIVRIPPRSPELRLASAAATLATLEDTELSAAVRNSARAEIYAALAAEIREAQEHAAGVSSVLDHITLEEAAAFQKQRSVRGG